MERDVVLCGDALTVLRELPSESVQCCISSPPYFGLRDYQVEGQIGLEETPEQYVARLVAVFREVRRVLRRDGTCWVNMGDSYANDEKWGGRTGGKHAQGLHGESVGRNRRRTGLKPKDLIGVPWMLAFALRADGWWLRSDIVWHKPNPMPESVTDRPTKAHEYIFLLSKSERYYYDGEAIREEARYGYSPTVRGTFNGSIAGIHTSRRVIPGNGGSRNKRTVWTVSTFAYPGSHFATFPPALIEPCVLAGSRPGDVVLDPFAGSGTTCAVAKRHSRHWLGIELNPAYIALAEQRIARELQPVLWSAPVEQTVA